MWGRCHRGAITGLATSPDGRFLFSTCSRGTLAQYHSGAPRCRVLRVAGQAPTPSPTWASQYLPDCGAAAHSLAHRPTGPGVVLGLPSTPEVRDQCVPALCQEGGRAGLLPWTLCLGPARRSLGGHWESPGALAVHTSVGSALLS